MNLKNRDIIISLFSFIILFFHVEAINSDLFAAEQLIYNNTTEGEEYQIYRVAKIAGTEQSWDTCEDIDVLNVVGTPGFYSIYGTDLGAITRCGDNYYFNLGDSIIEPLTFDNENPTGPWSGRNFLVGVSNYQSNFTTSTYLNLDVNDKPKNALYSCHNIKDTYDPDGRDGCYTIPNAMFSVQDGGTCNMFAQYMDVFTVGGNNHRSYASYITKFNSSTNLFDHYKENIYKWGDDATPEKRYDFAQASFVERDGYIYMFGAPSGRFGGLKVGRILTTDFINPDNTNNWQYYTNSSTWSTLSSTEEIRTNGKWIIEPKIGVSNYSYYNDYSPEYMTIAEFSVVYNEYLGKYMLITGRPDQGSIYGIYMYTSSNPQGPWTEYKLLPNQDVSCSSLNWSYYGTYTSSYLLENGGKIVNFLATTWNTYGVYNYYIDFGDAWAAACTPNCTNKCGGSDGCGGTCTNTCSGSTPLCKDNTTCVECVDSDDCAEGELCNAQNTCENDDNCTDKECGTDGCGGSCGSCGTGEVCFGDNECKLVDLDLNGDGDVKISDFLVFVTDFLSFRLGNPASTQSDLNGDDKISLSDYYIFVLEYIRLKGL